MKRKIIILAVTLLISFATIECMDERKPNGSSIAKAPLPMPVVTVTYELTKAGKCCCGALSLCLCTATGLILYCGMKQYPRLSASYYEGYYKGLEHASACYRTIDSLRWFEKKFRE